MTRRTLVAVLAAGATLLTTGEASAWGDDGHTLVAWVAYGLLTPTAKTKVDALLAADTDKLTPPEFGPRATWADKWRDAGGRKLHYKETKNWHFVDLQIGGADLAKVCNNFPKTPAGTPESAGDPNDCALDKINAFKAELADLNTPAPERLMALKFIMHFVGDIHQPLHSSTAGNDGGANCEQVRMSDKGRKFALHHYWDTETVDALIAVDPATPAADRAAKHFGPETLLAVGDAWRGKISAASKTAYAAGDTKAWVMQSYDVAKTKVFNLPAHPACSYSDDPKAYPAFVLPAAYQTSANKAVKLQIQRAGVRLAKVLNEALT
ncbi:MAG TPA: S1/P1 nuclease [Caulobacteraceae bacterium]|jgi:hypothetical protein